MAMAATPPMRARGRLIMIMPDRERLLNSWKSNRNIISKAMADVTYAWPSAVISALTPEAAVAVLYQDEVKADKELSVEEARAKYAGEYVEKVAGAVNAAKDGMVDDIIDPAKTRAMLISALEMLGSKRDSNPPKKHDNLPM